MSFHLDSICSSVAPLYVFCPSKPEKQDITACLVFNISVNILLDNESSQQIKRGNLFLSTVSMLGVNVQLMKFLEEVISSNLSVTLADMNRKIFHY